MFPSTSLLGPTGRVLFLGKEDSPLLVWLREQGEEVVQTMERLDSARLDVIQADFLVSYGYRFILGPEVLARFSDRAVNLHISYLPWNRGADPNLWSFLEETPKGVSLHYLDPGVDTGDIIGQRQVSLDEPGATLGSTYARLQAEVQALFHEHWPAIRAGRATRRPQIGAGSLHRARDRDGVMHLLPLGWDTPVAVLRGLKQGGDRT